MMKPQPSTSRYFSSPKKKRPKVTSFTVNEKNMVINTYKYVKETWPNDKYLYKKKMAHKGASILGHTVNKTWVDTEIKSNSQAFLEGLSTGAKILTSKGRRLIVAHIGNQGGFVDDGSWLFEFKERMLL